MDNKCRKRKLAQSLMIRDSLSEISKYQKTGTGKITSRKRKTTSEVKDRLRHTRKLNHDFILKKRWLRRLENDGSKFWASAFFIPCLHHTRL